MTDAKRSASRLIEDREQDQLADDVMDLVSAEFSGRGSAAFRPAEELERERREERHFLEAMAKHLHTRLAEHGIRILKIAADGVGEGYEIFARDNVGRPYQVSATYDAMFSVMGGVEQNERFRACFEHVTQQILKARQRYFERAQLC